MEKTSANIFMKYPALHHFASNNTGCYHFIIQFFYISKYIHFPFSLFKNLIQSFNYLIIIDMIFHIITLFKLFSFNCSCPRYLRHFGNPKNENLLRSPKFYGENEFLVEMCISQLITEILSFFCFHKNFMANLSFQIVGFKTTRTHRSKIPAPPQYPHIL